MNATTNTAKKLNTKALVRAIEMAQAAGCGGVQAYRNESRCRASLYGVYSAYCQLGSQMEEDEFYAAILAGWLSEALGSVDLQKADMPQLLSRLDAANVLTYRSGEYHFLAVHY